MNGLIIEVVTRHLPGREKWLARNRAALAQQTANANTMHTVITDAGASGVPVANGRLRDFEPLGDYVWIVDDDDYISGADTVEEVLSVIETHHRPDAVMVRYGVGTNIVPEDEYWQKSPELAHISGQCAIVTADLWRRTRAAWPDDYSGDFFWQKCVYERADKIAWLPLVAVRTDKPGRGRADL